MAGRWRRCAWRCCRRQADACVARTAGRQPCIRRRSHSGKERRCASVTAVDRSPGQGVLGAEREDDVGRAAGCGPRKGRLMSVGTRTGRVTRRTHRAAALAAAARRAALAEKLGREFSPDAVGENGWTDLHWAAALDLRGWQGAGGAGDGGG